MPLLLLLIFIVVPIVELAVIIKVGQLIGLWPTVALLFLSAILGSMLLRSQGRAVWRRFNQAVDERRVPHREVFDGVLVIFGGALLLTPGFLTDIAGLILLIPPSRDLIRGLGTKLFFGRYVVAGRAAGWSYNRARSGRGPGPATAGGPPPGGASPPPPRRPSRDYDVEGTAHEIRDESLLDSPQSPPDSLPER